MEFAQGGVKAERALAAAVLAAVATAVWLEARSPIAACARARKPWAAWLAFEAAPEPPRLYLALFHPGRRAADVIYVPDSTRGLDGRPLSAVREDALANDADAAGAAKDEADAAREALSPLLALDARGGADRFIYCPVRPIDEPDAALAGARWLSGLPARLMLSPRGARTNVGRVERALIALELSRLRGARREGLRPAWLPENDNDRRALLGRLSTETPFVQTGRLTVEVLNATGRRGLALEATKVLRSSGADVMSSGNAPQRRARTVIYDRTGAIENALRVKRMLGCDGAEAVGQAEARRLYDVTVVLADDCAKKEDYGTR